jgi:H+-transporting ATPase
VSIASQSARATPQSSEDSSGSTFDLEKASVSDVLSSLHSDSKTGLKESEVEAARKEHGYNEVLAPKANPITKFLGKFWGISAWMMELIIVLSAILRNYSDLAVVSALLVLNAIISFTQGQRAMGVVASLRKRLQVKARVLRDSAWKVIPVRELVPGDIVRVRSGDIVPADVKVLTGTLSLDQSALTGESKNAEKTVGQVAASGSVVRRGESDAVVLLIGAKTSFGHTTELVEQAEPKLHIEAVVSQVVRWLFVIVGVLLTIVIILSLVRHEKLLNVVPILLVLLLSAVPVSLPVMFTISLAVGSKELASQGVLVTRLSATEDAATMDVLCVDKTGTITMNQLAVVEVVPLGQASESDVLIAGALASEDADQDPIDLAFLAAAKDKHAFDGVPSANPISFVPFDASNRRTEAVVEQNGQNWRVMKGAVRTIAETCGVSGPALDELDKRVSASAAKGYRMLAVARGEEHAVPVLLGLISLYNPPRSDAKQLISELQNRGVAVKMLTGDAIEVATQIGSGVGLPIIRTVGELKAVYAKSASKDEDLFEGADGYAEVFPEDKYTVVKDLQAAGHITGMTGDGVNDAPALRQAEVGIAVSSATDVAKSAASVILTQPGLTDIVSLVEQGRTIYQRILTWIIHKIGSTILKASFVSIAYIVTGKFVMSAIAMLLLTFITDFSGIALATDGGRPSPKPETWKIGPLVSVGVAVGIAMLIEALSLLAFAWSHFNLDGKNDALNSFSFLLSLYFGVFSLVVIRERKAFWASMPSKPLLTAWIGVVFAGTLLTRLGSSALAPLPWGQTAAIFFFALGSCLVVNDALKVALIKWRVPSAVE